MLLPQQPTQIPTTNFNSNVAAALNFQQRQNNN
jgi:hypothetical protein